MSSIADALGATTGIVSVTGAGGKKTLMRLLALAHTGRVCLTATVRIAPLGDMPDSAAVFDQAARLPDRVAALAGPRIVFCALPEAGKRGRYEGLMPGEVAALHRAGGFDLTVVKADGARMRAVKAPGPGEPLVADGTTLLVPVMSVAVLGRPLDQRIAHRPERVAAVSGAEAGEALTALHLARLLASPEGAMRGAGRAKAVAVLSHADDDEAVGRAREVAELALGMTPALSRIVIAALREKNPVKLVLERRRGEPPYPRADNRG